MKTINFALGLFISAIAVMSYAGHEGGNGGGLAHSYFVLAAKSVIADLKNESWAKPIVETNKLDISKLEAAADPKYIKTTEAKLTDVLGNAVDAKIDDNGEIVISIPAILAHIDNDRDINPLAFKELLRAAKYNIENQAINIATQYQKLRLLNLVGRQGEEFEPWREDFSKASPVDIDYLRKMTAYGTMYISMNGPSSHWNYPIVALHIRAKLVGPVWVHFTNMSTKPDATKREVFNEMWRLVDFGFGGYVQPNNGDACYVHKNNDRTCIRIIKRSGFTFLIHRTEIFHAPSGRYFEYSYGMVSESDVM